MYDIPSQSEYAQRLCKEHQRASHLVIMQLPVMELALWITAAIADFSSSAALHETCGSHQQSNSTRQATSVQTFAEYVSFGVFVRNSFPWIG